MDINLHQEMQNSSNHENQNSSDNSANAIISNSDQSTYIEHLKKLDKNLTILIISLIIITIISVISRSSLDYEEIRLEYNKCSEFLDNHEIFNRYLNMKRDLYHELNRTIWDSTGGKYESGEWPKYYNNPELFGDINVPWGWDKFSLDDKITFSEIVTEAFLFDFHCWSTEHWKGKTLKSLSGDTLPDSIIQQYYDIERRLRRLSKNNSIIVNFFNNNLEMRINFLKDILIKYDIPFPDSIKFKQPKHCHVVGLNEHLKDYLNDSEKSISTIFRIYGLAFSSFNEGKGININFYDSNQTADSICSLIFEKYVRDKFSVYDSKIFKNKLPYSSYVDRIKRDHENLEKKLESKNITPLRIESPILKMDIKPSFWYYLVCWLLCLVSWLTRNIFRYRDNLIKKLKINDSNNLFDINLNPSFLNLISLGFKRNSFDLKVILTLVHLAAISVLFFYIFVGYHELIFKNDIAFFLFSILPMFLTIIVVVCFYIAKPLCFLRRFRR